MLFTLVDTKRPSLRVIVHHKIRGQDCVVVIHHEFVVVQAITDFSYDLAPRQ